MIDGFRITKSASIFISTLDSDKKEYIIKSLKGYKGLVTKETIEQILMPKIEISNRIPAQDITPSIEIKSLDIPSFKVDSDIDAFINYYRNRFSRIKKFFRYSNEYEIIEIDKLDDVEDGDYAIIGIIFDIVDRNKYLQIHLEDLSGIKKFYISKNSNLYKEFRDELMLDDVIMIEGKKRGENFFIENILYPTLDQQTWPEIDFEFEALYISDLHFGSKYLNRKYLDAVLKYLKEKNKYIKYIIIGGDIVDGVGVYPNQEKELEVLDIEKQYKLFNEFVEKLPDYLEIIVIPGNHDAVRRAEPSEPISNELIYTDVHLLPNPAYFKIHGFLHLVYHGTSLDGYISSFPGISYEKGYMAAIKMLKRRHLSSIHGKNIVAPLSIDHLVITDIPNIFQLGHIHKSFIKSYNNIYIVNSGTFQNQTPFQAKVGLIPDLGKYHVFNFKTRKFYYIGGPGGI
jgi:DNA polymerase II small subunit